MIYQKTLSRPVKCSSIGLHSGKLVNLSISPASACSGINFIRTDIKSNNLVQARFDNVIDTKLCTVLGNDFGVRIGTIEHLMAALFGCDIDNALIFIDAEEIPIMDGSSAPFVALLGKAGIAQQNLQRRFLKITEEIVVEQDDKYIKLSPYPGFAVDACIEFEHPKIGNQRLVFDINNDNFNFDISRARTFGYCKDVEKLKAMGFARGASLDNAVGLSDESIVNPKGLRYENEFVKHKILDCIGDIYLSGYHIIGAIKTYKPSHSLNNAILRKLFATKEVFEVLQFFDDMPVKSA
jgi:UDP-3-O-[3-hydroxymyristoyl] N-acetylglucosamine deacetylase